MVILIILPRCDLSLHLLPIDLILLNQILSYLCVAFNNLRDMSLRLPRKHGVAIILVKNLSFGLIIPLDYKLVTLVFLGVLSRLLSQLNSYFLFDLGCVHFGGNVLPMPVVQTLDRSICVKLFVRAR